ncbi:cyclin-dependent kinase 11B-like isoform X2 [Bolinopsis microptera]|uniref:cyclin-dependent kinase 11B-like isoform X2 n=1 Tax=Bolinopsis microptera TaxID=2820187 RepID=UPI0030796643
MSDDSEPGEIKSPDLTSINRSKRSTEDKRSYKAEKKIKLEKDFSKLGRDEYKDYRKEDYRREDRSAYDRDRKEYERDHRREYDKEDRKDYDRVDKRDSEYYRKDDAGGKRSSVMPRKEELREEKRKDGSLKEKPKVKEEKASKKRSDDERERVKTSREEEIREEIRSITEEIQKDKRRDTVSPSSSSDRKEKKDKKDPVKKKKKEGRKNKEKQPASTQEKYEQLLKEKLSGPSPQSPEEVTISSATVSTMAAKKKSLLIDSSESSDNEGSDEDLVEAEPSPVALRPTPSPSPPPDPLAGLPPYYPALQGCRNVDHFEYLNRIEEGTYGVVFRARDKRTNEHVALKKLKMEKEKQGFPITSLREINTLLKGQHENVVHVREIVVGSNMDKIYIVMDYVEHDLKSLMENMKEPFLIGEIKTIMRQLMSGLAFLHDNWIVHRDIKSSNLLFSHGGILKIGDFGLAREYGSPLKQYTEIVVTLWYRAPELLLGCKLYSVPIDVWSAGCVFGELLSQKPLFPGKSEIDQINKIFKELGTPNERIWPGYSELPATQRVSFVNHPYNKIGNRYPVTVLSKQGLALLNKLLCYDPAKRITAAESYDHQWFKEGPLPVDPTMFPTWPAKSEMNANPKKKIKSPTPPEGGGAADKLENSGIQSGFKFLNALQGSSAKGPGFSLKF